jgi:hypothetical protein
MEPELTPAEQAIVDAFSKQLGLALRRIADLESTAAPTVNLPQAVPLTSTGPSSATTPVRRQSKPRQEQKHDDQSETSADAADLV